MGVSTLIFDQKWNTTMHCSQEMEVLMDICVLDRIKNQFVVHNAVLLYMQSPQICSTLVVLNKNAQGCRRVL